MTRGTLFERVQHGALIASAVLPWTLSATIWAFTSRSNLMGSYRANLDSPTGTAIEAGFLSMIAWFGVTMSLATFAFGMLAGRELSSNIREGAHQASAFETAKLLMLAALVSPVLILAWFTMLYPGPDIGTASFYALITLRLSLFFHGLMICVGAACAISISIALYGFLIGGIASWLWSRLRRSITRRATLSRRR